MFSATAGHAEHKHKPPGTSPVSGEKGGSENAQMCSHVCVCVCVCVSVCTMYSVVSRVLACNFGGLKILGAAKLDAPNYGFS